MPCVVRKETKKTNICKQVSITIYYICLFAKKVYIYLILFEVYQY